MQCDICNQSFGDQRALSLHRSHKHNLSKTICHIATRRTYTPEQFTKLLEKYRPCPECGNEFLPYDRRAGLFCSHSCSAKRTNRHKAPPSETTRQKIRKAALGAPRITKTCVVCHNAFQASTSAHVAKYCSRRCWNVLNKPPKLPEDRKPTGGCRERSGRSKYGYYEGIWCQSTYEMAFVWYCKSTGKEIVRNTEGFPYIGIDDEKHLYYPDFIIEGRYKEVKGYLRENDKNKLRDFPHPIDLIIDDEIKTIVRKAKSHFGVGDLSTLYAENKRPTFGQVECGVCGQHFDKPRKTSLYCSRKCSGKAVRQIDHPRSIKLNHSISIPELKETDTQGKVKTMVLHGNTTSEIATVLGISTASVSYHRKKLNMLSNGRADGARTRIALAENEVSYSSLEDRSMEHPTGLEPAQSR